MAKSEIVKGSVEKDAEELKRQRKAAKKAAKEAAAAAAEEAEHEVDEAEEKRKRKAAKKAAKAAAAAAEEEAAPAEEVDEAEEKKKRKAAKKAAKEAAAAAEEAAAEPEVDEAEAKKARNAAKRAAKEAAAAAEAEEAEAEEPPKKKKKKSAEAAEETKEEEKAEAGETKSDPKNELTAFVRGLPFSCEEEVLKKDFLECGPIEKINMPMNDEGRPRGIAFIKFETQAGLDAALKFDNTEYGGRTIFVVKAGEGGKGKGKDGKGKGKDGKGKGNDEFTVFVRGLPFSVEEEALNKDFTECGEIERLNLPKNEEGNPKGIAFIKYKTQEAVDAALKFNETEYGGRTIYVSKAGEGGKGKGKDGKDGKDGKGKGKGKDGKGKKGKGKKGGLSGEKMAAQSGAMVESTGEKKTFDDSDDE